MEIKNLEKAAKRILKATEKKENIILYGDADLDGVTSTILLKEAIQDLGGKISAIYFPDREKEGYGLTQEGLRYLKKFSPAIIIILDLGIGNFQEVKLAKELGFGVVIVDHHEPLDELPEAEIVVDPKQKGDKYSFKELATVGVTFKLAEALLGDKMTDLLRENFLELVALGTIADMMPQINENQIFIDEGLNSIKNSFRPGIKSFFEMAEFINFNFNQKLSKLIAVLNVREGEKNLPASFRLLTSSSIELGKDLIKDLMGKAERRKEKIDELIVKIEEKDFDQTIIFEGGEDFEFNTISTIASILCRKYEKPAFIFKKLEKESVGTVRVPKGINSVALMKKCKEYLLTFGGHPLASGFRIKNENLENFKECLILHLEQPISEGDRGNPSVSQ